MAKTYGHAEEVNDTVVETMEEIEAADGVEYTTVEGYKPGQKLRLGSVTAGDMIDWSEANEGEAKRTAGIRLILKSIVNSKGERIADDNKNIALFRKKSHKDSERIVRAILKLNGMGEANTEKVKND